ncbi:MAG TPA: ABC transporter ATP-binding protein [Opitutaceae bacterium]|nr:ABC transporter ATP-binding protein [Opitutaceae bacterium]
MSNPFTVLWNLMQGQRLRYGAALLCLVLATAANYLVPLVGAATIDHAIGNRPVAEASPLVAALLHAVGGAARLGEQLWLAPVLMVLLTAAGGACSYLKGRYTSLASDGIARRLKDDLYDHLNHLPARTLDRSDTGDLVQRCTSDVETTRQFLAVQVMEIGNALILAATALPLLLLLSPPMTLVAFALIPPLVIYGYVYFRKVRHVFKAVDEAEGALTSVIQENLTGIRVVRAFARQDFERTKFAGPNATFRDRNLRLLRLMSWYWSVSDLVALSQLGLVLLVGASWVGQGKLTVGVLFAFLAFLGIMLWPVRQMGRILTDLGKTSVAVGRIQEILAEQREADPVGAPPPPSGPLRGSIVVQNLHFAHARRPAAAASASRAPPSAVAPTSADPGAANTEPAVDQPDALNGISFEVTPGETLAVLGPSGGGKSTLMHLLLRLYDYERGSIRLDGRELSSLPRSWGRGQFGTVMQEPFLFSKSLRDNIRLGRGDAPDREIEEAARAACIDDTIRTFEQGYETLIGERGITLSGGQRQRIAIARAILRNPPVLILDDALSAVDGETETLILDALKRRRGHSTTLVIAHRLSTLAHADRVIVLDHGRIIQMGTHEQLAASPGLYRRLWEIQTSVEADFQRELQTQ